MRLDFSPDGRWLAALGNSQKLYLIDRTEKAPGWRGNLLLYEVETGRLCWQNSIDQTVTNDPRSLAAAGHPMGYFFNNILFIDDRLVACGATRGTILIYDVTTGALA